MGQPRPWIGCYSPKDNDRGVPEYIPMSWLPDGRFSNEIGKDGAYIRTGADVEELGVLYKQIQEQ